MTATSFPLTMREEMNYQLKVEYYFGKLIIIPPKLRERMLCELHEWHPGIVKMKAVAIRNFFGMQNWILQSTIWLEIVNNVYIKSKKTSSKWITFLEAPR